MVDMAYVSEGVDRREAIPMVPKASHDTGYTYQSTTQGRVMTCNIEMLQWPLALWLAWLCVAFLRASEITFPYLKLVTCENKLLVLTFGNSKYSKLKRKIKVNRTNMGQEDFTALTGIAQLHIEFPSAHLSNCSGVLTFITFL